MHALQHVGWEPCVLEPSRDRALEAYARRKLGIPNPTLRYFVSVPWLARAITDLHPEHGLLMRLEQQVADLVALVVSQENSCRFCYAVARAFLLGQGMSRARIQRVEQDLAQADLPPRTVAALNFARSQSRHGPSVVREACDALTRSGFAREEMHELAFAVASMDFMNRVHAIPAIPARALEELPDQFPMRLVWPFVYRFVSSRAHRGHATPLTRLPAYPYARTVATFSGSPIAPMLVRTLDEMWASPILTRRCKLLMLAVIARALGCERCASEMSNAAIDEGLHESALADALAHLDAPWLDPVERLLLPFARETVWFEPVTIQRRARALRDRLSEAQLIEAIGVASVGNALCRLNAFVAA